MSTVTETQIVPLPTRTPPPEPMTYQQFLDWVDEDTHAEWVNGKVIFMSPVSREHALVKGFLYQIILYFVSTRDLGELYDDPFQMKTGPDLPGRAPDVIFVSKQNLGRLKPNYLDGAADLAVEIISPDGRSRDRGEKFYEYEEGGVKEYWLIDPPRKQAEFYQLSPDGYYRPVAVSADGRFESLVLTGFWLKVQWLWQRPLHTLPQILKEWGL